MLRSAALGALISMMAASALADIGPKPTIAITLAPDRPHVAIRQGELLECDDRRCAAPRPLRRLGPQHFDCQALACSGLAYGFADWLVLRLTLTDGRRLRSAPFAHEGFDARYK